MRLVELAPRNCELSADGRLEDLNLRWTGNLGTSPVEFVLIAFEINDHSVANQRKFQTAVAKHQPGTFDE